MSADIDARHAAIDGRGRATVIAGVLITILMATAPQWLSPFNLFLLTRAVTISALSMSLVLLAGHGGMLSLAQVAFFGAAGYTVGIGSVQYGLPFEVVVPLAILIAVIVSAIFGLMAIRTHGVYFLMMTVAFAQVFYSVALQWNTLTGGYNGLRGIPSPELFGYVVRDPADMYYFILILAALCYLFLRQLTRSSFGLALRGCRDSSKRMAALGFSVQLHRYLAIVVSGAVAGVGGILSVYFYGLIGPDSVNLSAAIMVLFVALLGGITRLEGALVGALVYVLLEDFASQYTQRYQMIIGLFFVLVVMFLPRGITGVLGARSGLGDLLPHWLRRRSHPHASTRTSSQDQE